MNNKIFNKKSLIITGLILVAVFSRFINHIPNFTPMVAIILFAGAYFERKHLAFFIPLAAMLISDIFIGFHQSMWAVYISYVLIATVGILLSKKMNLITIIASAIGSSVVFYLITNFGSWIYDPQYTKDFAGLIASYVKAIPFFRTELLSNLFYCAVFFGAFEFVAKRYPAFISNK